MPDLKRALYEAVSEIVPEDSVAVAFSGGVDSSLLARICQDLGKKITLLTVGFPGSPDIAFSKKVAILMGMKHQLMELNYEDFQSDLRRVLQSIGCKNTSHMENCVAYFYIAKLASRNGLQVLLSANGCDELFCGYDGYRAVYSRGEAAMVGFMDEKIASEFELVQEIATIAGEFGVRVKQPFLSERFIAFAKSVSIEQKIKNSKDMLRKHILRQVALSIGVPEEAAMKPKKALQYGSSIHRYFGKARQDLRPQK